MNIEQRMSTPIPKFADSGQDMTSYEVLRLEQLLLEFGQRDSPTPQAPVNRPPLTRKRSQSYIEGVADTDKRPRLQWRKKEDRDQSGRIASWTDDRVPPPGVPRPPAPVTGTRTSLVYKPPQPRARESASPKEDFPKRNVSAGQNVANKGKGQGSSTAKGPTVYGPTAPVKGTPRGSVGRAMSFLPEDRAPRRGNIPKDLLGPPLRTPPPVPAAKPQIPKPPSNPPPLPVKQAPMPPAPKPSPPKVPPPKVPPPKVPPPDISSAPSGIPAHSRPTDFNLTPKPPPLTDLYNRLQPSVKGKGKGKQQANFRGGPYDSRQWNLQNVPPPPLPSGAPPTSASSSSAPVIGQPTVRGADERPLEPFDFPGVQWQRTDPWADNYWPNHMELRQWMEHGWHDETERFGYRHY